MNLEEFVKTTLHQIINAVASVDEESEKATHGVDLVRSTQGGIEFDLAVSASSAGSSSKSGGIKVLEVLQGGLDKKQQTLQSTVSRIKFRVNA